MGDIGDGGKTEGDIESVADRKEIFKVGDKEGRGERGDIEWEMKKKLLVL
jgi:hypothetical protein